MDLIVTYLKTGEQLKDKTEARILLLKAARYVLYNDKLYRKGYSMPLLKCVSPSNGGLSLTFKAVRQGYYWPTMKTDCMEYARKCDKCQLFATISKAHPEELTS